MSEDKKQRTPKADLLPICYEQQETIQTYGLKRKNRHKYCCVEYMATRCKGGGSSSNGPTQIVFAQKVTAGSRSHPPFL